LRNGLRHGNGTVAVPFYLERFHIVTFKYQTGMFTLGTGTMPEAHVDISKRFYNQLPIITGAP